MNQDHSIVFEIASKDCISDSLVNYKSYPISSKGFLPTVVDTTELTSSELNSPIPIHFSSLIPKVSMLTLAISCLTMYLGHIKSKGISEKNILFFFFNIYF